MGINTTKINQETTAIIERIKEIRSEKGFSLENMANELNISTSAYNKIEKEDTKLTVERLFQIQQALEISLADMLNLKAEKIYNQHIKDSGIGHQEVKNLYQENKTLTEAYITSLKEEIEYLKKLQETAR